MEHLVLYLLLVISQYVTASIHLPTVDNWAATLGTELKTVAGVVTRKKQAQLEFDNNYTLVERNDVNVTEEIMENIKSMMSMKIDAIKRIMDSAENAALSEPDEYVPPSFAYYNAKCLTNVTNDTETIEEPCSNQTLTCELGEDPHFGTVLVNTSFSAVHVPTNVFDRARDVIKPIKWSSTLDPTFRDNFERDPSLYWQYFCSSTGFMRQFPAMRWKQNPVDLYDCRTRSWYIQAAVSPKDVVILLDVSGSMTGLQKEIARHIVNDILDTLGNNDYVNIFKFNDSTMEVVDCFSDRLVQANLANIREFKQAIERLPTMGIANFTEAFIVAFDLLKNYREDDLHRKIDRNGGASCNQAIMLITDGVPSNFHNLFKEYNWPEIPVRLFTYLVGPEATDVREMSWMACANRGYYVHLSTQAEVREQVLQYVPVMARPMVLHKINHPVVWTPFYADIEDPNLPDWFWERVEYAVQKQVFQDYRRMKEQQPYQAVQFLTQYAELLKLNTRLDDLPNEYLFMTSVSIPVFDRRENAIIRPALSDLLPSGGCRKVDDSYDNYTTVLLRQMKIANLLGVAGTDVPIAELKKLTQPHKLGVNGYAFMVTNNGYVLFHPDLRPVFQGILKPNYNSVDMVEIEQVDDGREPREFNHKLLKIRERVVLQLGGEISEPLLMKYHLDGLKRVGLIKRRFYYAPIRDSPFTLVVAAPVQYGKYRVHGEFEVKRYAVGGIVENVTNWLKGQYWRVHPDWVYCDYVNASYMTFGSPEERYCHFLGRSLKPGWYWPSSTSHHQASSGKGKETHAGRHYCDRDLFQSLLHDAKVTKWFTQDITANVTDREKKLIEKFGLITSFIAMRSGLTRWQDFDSNSSSKSFGDLYPRSIEEIWYRRAVEHNHISSQQENFVYSVPFDIVNQPDGEKHLVTASHAVFVTNVSSGERAPAGVVGFQFKLSALQNVFNETVCINADRHNIECFLIDDNGYIVMTRDISLIGQFFGSVKHNVMRHLIHGGLYRKIRIFDYQAVCFKEKANSNRGNSLFKPIQLFIGLLQWVISRAAMVAREIGFTEFDYISDSSMDPDEDAFLTEDEESLNKTRSEDEEMEGEEEVHKIKRTRLQTCDHQVELYLRTNDTSMLRLPAIELNCKRPFTVFPLQESNLLLVVVSTVCPCKDEYECYISVTPREVGFEVYNNTLACHKLYANDLPRRRPHDCISHHDKEKEIEMCGHANSNFSPFFLIVTFSWVHGLVF